MLNLYVKNKATEEILDFNGLSLGEARQFLLDLYKRELRINGILGDDLESQSKEYENLIYDEMSPEEFISKSWDFSDRTITIEEE